METTLLLDSQIAELLCLSPRQVLRLAKRGKIPHIVLPNGEIRFDFQDVKTWLKTCTRLPGEGGNAIEE
ncbi:MAG: helix-turn-helix domain-containing protein [Pirellulales bacterium]|nr:helix-turn-helix domain-containing protein [Pirellulales bacterium]